MCAKVISGGGARRTSEESRRPPLVAPELDVVGMQLPSAYSVAFVGTPLHVESEPAKYMDATP